MTEGQTTFNSSFIKSVSTEIVIDRKFTIPGYIYNLTLVSYNMHDITAPNIILRWHIECQNPVVPEDWSLLYHPNIHFGQMFEITLEIEPEKALPTRPTISVYAVKGFPGSGEGEWAMRRWDHAPFYAMLKPEYIVPFYVKDDKSDEAKRVLAPGSAHWGPGRIPKGWWEPLRTEENKDTPPPELMIRDEYTFRYMGVENQEEREGKVESGNSATRWRYSFWGKCDRGRLQELHPLLPHHQVSWLLCFLNCVQKWHFRVSKSFYLLIF